MNCKFDLLKLLIRMDSEMRNRDHRLNEYKLIIIMINRTGKLLENVLFNITRKCE